jgi:Flp pilus assembly protein TadG
MSARTLIEKLRKVWRNFRTANSGNVLITFTLTTIPIMGFVGSAVDYSRANSAKAAMQAAVDATALMLSKNISTLTTSQITTEATNYFNALFNRTEVNGIVITPTYTTSGGAQIVVTGTGTVPTTFMKVMGVSTMNINVSSTVKWGNARLRVALVLDNTGSMADDGKIAALKTATKNLLTQLQSAATNNGDVYVSIIPFVKDVNLDRVNYNANWIDWTDWNAANGSCSDSSYNSQSSCTSHSSCSLSGYTSQSSCTAAGTCNRAGYTTQSTCVQHHACTNPAYTTSSTCTSHGGSWNIATWTPGSWSPETWTPDNHNTWNGCVVDRGNSGAPSSGNYDTNVTAPTTAITATLYAAEQYGSCPQAVMPLSYNWSGMTTLVNNMSPGGLTNQAIGLQLGWMSLVGGGPFGAVPAMDPNYKYQQVIILLTDGLNTQDRWYTSQTSIDNREQLTCNNINAAGLTLYTVQVNTGGDPTSQLLRNCAGSPGKYPDADKFFLLTSASAMVTTFNEIGTALSNLRVAK